MGSKRHFFDCVRMPDLVSDRKLPFSIHRSDCIRIGLGLRSEIALFDPPIRLHNNWPKQAHPFFRSKHENQKLGIGSHSNQKADPYANPIPSFRFWSGRKNKYNSCKIETGVLCGDGTRVICFFARVIQQQLGFRSHTIQANVVHCSYVRHRTECTSLCPGLQAPKPALTDSSLAAKRCAEALHVVFFSTKHPSPAQRVAALCVLSYDT